MRLFLIEFKHLLRDWLLWSMVFLALVINTGMIFLDPTLPEYYYAYESIINQYGNVISEKTVESLGEEAQSLFNDANNAYRARFGHECSSVDTLYNLGYLDDTSYYRILMLQSMLELGENRIDSGMLYDTDSFEISRSIIFHGQVFKLTERLSVAETDCEAMYFTAAQFLPVEKQLYGGVLPVLYVEILLIAIYLTLKTKEREYIHRTCPVIYSTRRGRRVELSKQWSVMALVVLLFILITALSFLVYFIRFPIFSSLNISCYARVYPLLVTKNSISEYWYLILNLLLGLSIAELGALLAGGFALRWRNSYAPMLGVLGIVAVFAGCQWLCGDRVCFPDLLLSWNPMSLFMKIEDNGNVIFRLQELFCYSDECYSIPFYEIDIIFTWLILLSIHFGISQTVFLRRELST